MEEKADGPVILCYDGSEGARGAIREAAELLAPCKAIVLHVWEQPPTTTYGELIRELEISMGEEADRRVEEGAAVAREAGFEAEPVKIRARGSVAATILEEVEGRSPAAVVVGSRGLSGVRSLLGSVSAKVVHHASRPIVVVPAVEDED